MNLEFQQNKGTEVLRAGKNIFYMCFNAYLLTEGREEPFAPALVTI